MDLAVLSKNARINTEALTIRVGREAHFAQNYVCDMECCGYELRIVRPYWDASHSISRLTTTPCDIPRLWSVYVNDSFLDEQ